MKVEDICNLINKGPTMIALIEDIDGDFVLAKPALYDRIKKKAMMNLYLGPLDLGEQTKKRSKEVGDEGAMEFTLFELSDWLELDDKNDEGMTSFSLLERVSCFKTAPPKEGPRQTAAIGSDIELIEFTQNISTVWKIRINGPRPASATDPNQT